MATLEKRVKDMERPIVGPTIYAVVDTMGKSEAEVLAEVAAAHARYPGREVCVFIKRRAD